LAPNADLARVVPRAAFLADALEDQVPACWSITCPCSLQGQHLLGGIICSPAAPAGELGPGVVSMDEASHHPEQLVAWIARLQAGDDTARAALLGHACDQLRALTRKMLRHFARLKRWEETDDVLQNALLRLWNALRGVTPRSAREFYALASLQIRRVLIDLVRQYHGPEGLAANQSSYALDDPSSTDPRPAVDRADTTYEPEHLAVWSEFHRLVDTLPEEEREVFDLLWYQEIPQLEAARLLGISEATLRRRWLAARRRLHQSLKAALPDT
jgi:RNA polymerase sigma-70 factor (ECF subfamily)